MPEADALKPIDYFRSLVSAGREGEARAFAEQALSAPSATSQQVQSTFRMLAQTDEDRARKFAQRYSLNRQFGFPRQEAAHRAFEEARPTTLTGVLSTAAEGLTAGFSDELMGLGARAVGRPEDEVQKTLQDVRAQREAFSRRHPVLSFGAEVIPGIASAGLGARGVSMAAQRLGAGDVLRTVPGAIGLGAAEGALAGAGYAEPGQRLAGAARGAALGGGLGAGFAGVPRMYQGFSGMISNREQRVINKAEKAIRPRVSPAFVTQPFPQRTAFQKGKKGALLDKFLREDPVFVEQQLAAMPSTKRAAHQRRFLKDLDKAFGKTKELSESDRALISSRLPAIFQDNPNLQATIDRRLQDWVQTGVRPGMRVQELLGQVEKRVESFRGKALPLAIPGAFLDPVATGGSVAASYGLPALARGAARVAQGRLGPFPVGAVKLGPPPSQAAAQALKDARNAYRRGQRKKPAAPGQVGTETEAIRMGLMSPAGMREPRIPPPIFGAPAEPGAGTAAGRPSALPPMLGPEPPPTGAVLPPLLGPEPPPPGVAPPRPVGPETPPSQALAAPPPLPPRDPSLEPHLSASFPPSWMGPTDVPVRTSVPSVSPLVRGPPTPQAVREGLEGPAELQEYFHDVRKTGRTPTRPFDVEAGEPVPATAPARAGTPKPLVIPLEDMMKLSVANPGARLSPEGRLVGPNGRPIVPQIPDDLSDGAKKAVREHVQAWGLPSGFSEQMGAVPMPTPLPPRPRPPLPRPPSPPPEPTPPPAPPPPTQGPGALVSPKEVLVLSLDDMLKLSIANPGSRLNAQGRLVKADGTPFEPTIPDDLSEAAKKAVKEHLEVWKELDETS